MTNMQLTLAPSIPVNVTGFITTRTSAILYNNVKTLTHSSESRGQRGSSKQRPDGLETHTREYYTGCEN